MQIRELQLLTTHLAAQQEFYTRVLDLPCVGADPLTVQAGRSRLRFTEPAAGPAGVYHFAFNIPRNQFAAAKAWVSARVPLLRDSTGTDTFHSEGWNADMVYFADPAGNILEFIARHTLATDAPGPFTAASILSISEIGLATEDVPATVQWLETAVGVPVYNGPGSDTFTPVGDAEGLFIVVKQGRIWVPDTGIPAELLPVQVTVEASGAGQTLTGPPYRVTAE
ncbi:MAG TPA: hypothetical protein VM536_09470 [Chloroflexia bacterium]|nr:hypothetical protein [Chloroflexia bacterium]